MAGEIQARRSGSIHDAARTRRPICPPISIRASTKNKGMEVYAYSTPATTPQPLSGPES